MKNLLFRLSILVAGGFALFALFSLSARQVQKMMPPDKPQVVKQSKTAPGLNVQLDSDSGSSSELGPSVTSEADLLVHHPDYRGTHHDLSADEQAGGHTLRKHVGRSDDELRQRLAQESISASSTYTDRAAAEFAVGNALQENQGRIEKWLARSDGNSNLVLDYRSDQPVGRTLHRGDSASRPCNSAKVVLRWESSSEFYVLTSYPECR